MTRIDLAFVFSTPDESQKEECYFCGSNFVPYPLSITLYARFVTEEGEGRVLSDDATPMCPACILRSPGEVAVLARKNANRQKQRAEQISRKKDYNRTPREESHMESAPSTARDLHILAGTLDRMHGFSKVPDFALAAYIARFYIKPKGKPFKGRNGQERRTGKAA